MLALKTAIIALLIFQLFCSLQVPLVPRFEVALEQSLSCVVAKVFRIAVLFVLQIDGDGSEHTFILFPVFPLPDGLDKSCDSLEIG